MGYESSVMLQHNDETKEGAEWVSKFSDVCQSPVEVESQLGRSMVITS